MNDASHNWWHAMTARVKEWRARHRMGTFDAKHFCTSLALAALLAFASGWIILAQSRGAEEVHYAPFVGALLGFALGYAVGDTDVWHSPDWFPPPNGPMRRLIMLPFVVLGGGLGIFVETIWGIGIRS